MLSQRERFALSLIGVGFLAIVFVTKGELALALACLFAAAGIAALVIAANGVRISRIKAGPGGVDVGLEKAKEEVSRNPYPEPTPEPIRDPVTGEEPPAAEKRAFVDVPSSGTTAITADKKKVDVFPLSKVPLTVLKNLIEKWPDVPPPADFSEFEYAARRRGKGNFAWYMKFKTRAFWVGYGRGSVSVSPADYVEGCLQDARRHFDDLKARYDRGEGANEDATQAYNQLRAVFSQRASSLDYSEIEALVKDADVMFAEMKKRGDERA